MIKLKSLLNETSGWHDDSKKPKDIEKVEAKAEKWFGRLKKGWTPTTQYSSKLARLRDEWEAAVKKHKKKWKPKYNFGDLFA